MAKLGKQDWGEHIDKSIKGVVEIGIKTVVESKSSYNGLLKL